MSNEDLNIDKNIVEENITESTECDNNELSIEEALIKENEVIIAENEKLSKESAENLLGLQKIQAEFDNFRKRTFKEKDELLKSANGRLLAKFLPVMDNFNMALKVIDSKDNEIEQSLISGLAMVEKQLISILVEEGLKPIEAMGKEFDPQFHEAFLQEEKEGIEAGIVIEELQKGYLLNDKLLRPSLVKVSK